MLNRNNIFSCAHVSGSLRLSYQDTRLTYVGGDPAFDDAVKRRWVQVLSEGPDLVIVETESFINPLQVQQIVGAVVASRTFDGIVAFWMGKERFLSAGIKQT